MTGERWRHPLAALQELCGRTPPLPATHPYSSASNGLLGSYIHSPSTMNLQGGGKKCVVGAAGVRRRLDQPSIVCPRTAGTRGACSRPCVCLRHPTCRRRHALVQHALPRPQAQRHAPALAVRRPGERQSRPHPSGHGARDAHIGRAAVRPLKRHQHAGRVGVARVDRLRHLRVCYVEVGAGFTSRSAKQRRAPCQRAAGSGDAGVVAGVGE
jgi:hypothetical protein